MRMRDRRLSLRLVVAAAAAPLLGGVREPSGRGLVDLDEFCCARIAPALRSSRRCWPLARSGDIFETEAQSVIEARGSCEVNAPAVGVVVVVLALQFAR